MNQKPIGPVHHATDATAWNRYQSAGDVLYWFLTVFGVTSHFFPQARRWAPIGMMIHPNHPMYYPPHPPLYLI
jgi:hypothetical protein